MALPLLIFLSRTRGVDACAAVLSTEKFAESATLLLWMALAPLHFI